MKALRRCRVSLWILLTRGVQPRLSVEGCLLDRQGHVGGVARMQNCRQEGGVCCREMNSGRECLRDASLRDRLLSATCQITTKGREGVLRAGQYVVTSSHRTCSPVDGSAQTSELLGATWFVCRDLVISGVFQHFAQCMKSSAKLLDPRVLVGTGGVDCVKSLSGGGQQRLASCVELGEMGQSASKQFEAISIDGEIGCGVGTVVAEAVQLGVELSDRRFAPSV